MDERAAQSAVRESRRCQKLFLRDARCRVQDLCIRPLIVSVENEDIWLVHGFRSCNAIYLSRCNQPCFADLSDNKCPKVYSVIYKNRKNSPNRLVKPTDCRLGFWARSSVYRAISVGLRRISQEFQRRKRPI